MSKSVTHNQQRSAASAMSLRSVGVFVLVCCAMPHRLQPSALAEPKAACAYADLEARILCRQLLGHALEDRREIALWLVALGADKPIALALDHPDRRIRAVALYIAQRAFGPRRLGRPSARIAATVVRRIGVSTSFELENTLISHAAAAHDHRAFVLDSARGRTNLGRRSALRIIARWGPSAETTPLLVQALRDEDRKVRDVAFQALAPGKWWLPFGPRLYGPDRKVPPEDARKWVALWSEPPYSHHETVVHALVEALRTAATKNAQKTHWWTYHYDAPRAARWLARSTPTPATISALRTTMNRADPHARYRALESLIVLSRKWRLPTHLFVEVVRRGEPDSKLAIRALRLRGARGPAVVDAVRECLRKADDNSVRDAAIDMLLWLGDVTRERVLTLIDSMYWQPDVPRPGLASSEQAYRLVLSEVIEGANRRRITSALIALRAFAEQRQRSIPALKPLLYSDDLRLRFVVADTLASLGAPKRLYRHALNSAFRSEPWPTWVVAEAATRLPDHPDVLPGLVRALQDPERSPIALDHLAKLGGAATPVVPTLLNHAPEGAEFATECLKALGRIGHKSSAVSNVLRASLRHTDRRHRVEAIRALAALGHSRADAAALLDAVSGMPSESGSVAERLVKNRQMRDHVQAALRDEHLTSDPMLIDLLHMVGKPVPNAALERCLESRDRLTYADVLRTANRPEITDGVLRHAARSAFPDTEETGTPWHTVVARIRLSDRNRDRLVRTLSRALLRDTTREAADRGLIALPRNVALRTLRRAELGQPTAESRSRLRGAYATVAAAPR